MNSQFSDLQNIFEKQLTVETIAEGIQWYNIAKAQDVSEKNNFDYVPCKDDDGILKVFNSNTKQYDPLNHDDVIPDSTPLTQAFELIINKKRVFIKHEEEIIKIATISDLNKIPFRIWLFGTISILEFELRRQIRDCLGDDWQPLLSETRLNKAKELFKERKRRNQELDLIECTQLVDLCTIIVSNKQLWNRFSEGNSKKSFEDNFNKLNALRDQVVHTNKSFNISWTRISKIVNFGHGLIKILETNQFEKDKKN